MECLRCGAALTVPDDLYVETARCEYCGTVGPLPEELTRARALERQARERELERKAREESAKAQAAAPYAEVARHVTSTVRWVVMAGVLGMLVAAGVVGFLLLRGGDGAGASLVTTLSDAGRQANLAALETKLAPLRTQGCERLVVAPAARSDAVTLSLSMHADGNCARLAMASTAPAAALTVNVKPPAAAAFRRDDKGALELEHCPTETGEHAFALSGPTSGYAYAVVDCPPAREKFAADPEKNGSTVVSARLKTLRDSGCSKVLLAPERLSGSRTITSTMQPGRFCAVLVAATGAPGAKLALRASSPIGETLADIAPLPVVENVLCATTAGPHKVELSPTTPHYYTLAGIDCPKKVADKLQKERKK